jgi:hypothetical protein
LPKFGLTSFGSYIKLLPWFLILSCIVLIAVLEILAKRFSFIYRRPIVYSLIIIIIIVSIGGVFINKTPFHQKIFFNFQGKHIPTFDPFYRDINMMKNRGIYRGVVSELTDSGFVLQAPHDSVINVIIDEKTKFPSNKNIAKDDEVMVMGKIEGDNLKATGVLEINDNMNYFSPVRPTENISPPPRY